MTQIRFENMDMLIFVVSVGFVVVSLTVGVAVFPLRHRLCADAETVPKLFLC